jgi:uncharacterized protein YcgI (DUF1989 family)
MMTMRDALDFRRKFPVPPATLAHHASIRAAAAHYRLVDRFEIATPTGRGFRVARGHIARFLVSHGPQIVDLDVFNAADPSERLWANQTLNREGFWLSTDARLWSNMPHFRPLAAIVDDTVVTDQSGGPARHHHIFGGHCNPHYWYIVAGRYGLPNCYDNLCAAIHPFGLGPAAVHDNLNLFQKSRLLPDGTMKTARSDARVGDHVDFFAEMDLLLAASLCPRGSGATEPEDPVQERFPVTVEIFDTGFEPLPFAYQPAAGG